MSIENTILQNGELNRRKFISDTAKVVGSAIILSSSLAASAAGFKAEPVTVGQVMDTFIKEVPNSPFPKTVDTLKSGNREMAVTGIVTTMFATIDVIRKAIALNANFIIAHEPTFYNHADDTKWLENDSVYRYKADLLEQHQLTVWRNHDYVHSLQTDGVRKGLIDQLGWQNYGDPKQDIYDLLPAVTLKALITQLKQKLNIQTLRYVGNLNQSCKKILLMPGAAGGATQIGSLSTKKPDVLVCGEISEWETAEYVRDAQAKGEQVSLVVLGHIASEEPGSAFMAQWLKTHFADLKTTHISSGNSLSFL